MVSVKNIECSIIIMQELYKISVYLSSRKNPLNTYGPAPITVDRCLEGSNKIIDFEINVEFETEYPHTEIITFMGFFFCYDIISSITGDTRKLVHEPTT